MHSVGETRFRKCRTFFHVVGVIVVVAPSSPSSEKTEGSVMGRGLWYKRLSLRAQDPRNSAQGAEYGEENDKQQECFVGY